MLLLRILALALSTLTLAPGPVLAQTTPSPVNPREFITFAFSSASLQARASELAASRDTRPEVKTFAQGMVAFRREQGPRLQAAAQEQNIQIPGAKEFEHQVIFENLEPLDYLALSRRYAEIQIQALEQELRAYGAAAQDADPRLKALAEATLPSLQQHLEGARRMREAVGP